MGFDGASPLISITGVRGLSSRMPDSKVLSADVRQSLWDSFDTNPPLCYSSATLSPQGISAGMLRRVPINLNRQAEVGHRIVSSRPLLMNQEATIGLIKSALDRGVNIREVRIRTRKVGTTLRLLYSVMSTR